MFIIIALITFHLLSHFSSRFHFWPVLSDSLSQAFPNYNTYFGELSVSLTPHRFLLDGSIYFSWWGYELFPHKE